MSKVKKVCSICESDDVVTDGWLKWDIDKQEWVVDDIFDNGYCKSCEGEATVVDQKMEE
jgi:hypothetical protein